MASQTDRQRRRLQRWFANALLALATVALGIVLFVRFFDPPARPTSAGSTPVDAELAQVAQVIDGDTIDVLIDETAYRLRYIGIEAPQLGESLADLATARNRALVTGKTVRIVADRSEADADGRLLRYVYLSDGRLVNEILVQEGLARARSSPPDTALAAQLEEAQREAQTAKRGIWAPEK